ncbi:hypothetical protein CYLTODRAFT_494429 [Cylindrobasidium torrendii FP15055 ss-10]|uniref:Uncharacterized protein n=1 Tax=Cylindrobasidium torrendii FP15055 ss-10 TaxID=1314674 RepID=A0A0D7AZP8_9AGAR|nr:hypothetical protein CYLTODRAFT_494429 [Cylindrobasidium torrendii FP15055 ss-10]
MDPFEHRSDTRHKLLRFVVCFDESGRPMIPPRIISLIRWNASHDPAERRRAKDEFPPRIGRNSIGWLYWALKVDTRLIFNVLHNRAGTKVYHSPVSEGIFYRSHDDPIAALCASADNIRDLQRTQRFNIGHICPLGQALINEFAEEMVPMLTSGDLAENPTEYYSKCASPATLRNTIPVAPAPYVDSPSTNSEAQSEIISFGAQSWREGSSEIDNDDNPPSSPPHYCGGDAA